MAAGESRNGTARLYDHRRRGGWAVASGDLLMRKYREYLVPSILTTLSLAINEFVDFMLVSSLLGSEALVTLTMTLPITFTQAAIFVLIGNGGAILYATHLGRWQPETAGKHFSVSMLMAVLSGMALLAVGVIFKSQIITMFCVDASVIEDYTTCYYLLAIGSPVIIVLNSLLCFIPPCGAPKVATAVSIVTNGVNLAMDAVYILVFHAGVGGAFLATLTGQVVGLAVLIVAIKRKPIPVAHARIGLADIHLALDICRHGMAAAVLQVFYAVKTAVMNQLAQSYGGPAGISAYSMGFQTFSFAAIFLLGVADTAQPLLSMLSGQKDYRSEGATLRQSMMLQALFSLGITGFLALFPQVFVFLYGVHEETLGQLAMHGIRIIALTFLPRAICIQYMRYLQVEKHGAYALAISLLDGILVLPIAMALSGVIGIDGIFLSYPISAVAIVVFVAACNLFIYKREPDRYENVLLVRREEAGTIAGNFTIADDSQVADISAMSQEVEGFCKRNGVSGRLSMHVGLLCEEMAIYTMNHRQAGDAIDLLLRISDDAIELSFRSIGAPFDPLSRMDSDIPENVELLNSLSSAISYEYVMGMNNTKLSIAGR